jgi:DNA-binding MarR family transcriptional regulator
MSNESQIRIGPDFESRYPGASASATESAMNLVLTADLLLKRISELLLPLNLTPSAGLVLSLLADSVEPFSPHEIASRLIVSRASVTSLLDTLERQEFVRRRPHPSDRRMLMVEITEKGRAVADEFRPIVHRNQKIWFQNLTAAEREQLIALLHRVQRNLQAKGKE